MRLDAKKETSHWLHGCRSDTLVERGTILPMVRDKGCFVRTVSLADSPASWYFEITVTDSLFLLNNKIQGATWAFAKKLKTQLLNNHCAPVGSAFGLKPTVASQKRLRAISSAKLAPNRMEHSTPSLHDEFQNEL